jgi:hypothetical protein
MTPCVRCDDLGYELILWRSIALFFFVLFITAIGMCVYARHETEHARMERDDALTMYRKNGYEFGYLFDDFNDLQEKCGQVMDSAEVWREKQKGLPRAMPK